MTHLIKRFMDRLGLHNWRFVMGSYNRYYECAVCGRRKVDVPAGGGYQPIDRNWLET